MATKPSSSYPVSAPEQHSPASTPVNVEMVFRFWAPATRDGEATSTAHATGPNPGMLALIEDAVAAKRGVVNATHDPLHVSGLRRPADALVVSRQIQLGMQGFRGRHGVPPVALSIAIDASNHAPPAAAAAREDDATPAINDIPQPSHDLVTLLKLSKPAQILVTHDLCQRIASIKGLPLKSFQGRFGVFEYLWTGEEKLDLLQSEPQLTLAALPSTQHVASGPKNAIVAAGKIVAVSTRAETHGNDESAGEKASWWRTVLGSPQRMAIAALAVVVIGIAAVVGIHMSQQRSSAAAAKAAPAMPTATATPAAAVQSPLVTAATTSAAPANFPGASNTAPTASTPVPHEAPQKPRKATPAPEKRPAAPTAPTAACELSGGTARYLSLAQQYRGSGDYKSAVRLFNQILACEPSNAAAREGLTRAIQGQEQGQH